MLALPFHVSGKAVHKLLKRSGANSWIQTLEGPPIGDPDKRWGGEVEIFFVNLFCAFINAALMVVFFFFQFAAGCKAGLGVLGYAHSGAHHTRRGLQRSAFLQHPAEALFVLLSFFFLFLHSNTRIGEFG